ncbi:MAG: GntR family transcriptional regulator, partial [Pseudomonadota bacterium]
MLEADTVRLSKADFVYNRLRASIINGDRRPGDFLDKTELGREFGSSRQPLASALDRLAGDGLVKVIPQHGSFVSKLDAAQIRGRFFVRRAIEVEYVLELSGKVTDALIERLDLNLRYQRVALDAGDYDG